MTRKDYIKLVDVFKYGYDFANIEQARIINIMIDKACEVLKDDNPKFKKEIFIKAIEN